MYENVVKNAKLVYKVNKEYLLKTVNADLILCNDESKGIAVFIDLAQANFTV